ncbi:MAG: hypothetical protein ABSB19_17345 [Methylomonas sp.]|jgi:hypothetical protein
MSEVEEPAAANQPEGTILGAGLNPAPTDGEPAASAERIEAGAEGAAEAGAENQSADAEQQAGRNDDYADFNLPAGVNLNRELLGEFKQVAKNMGLNQEQAQALADLGVKQAQSIFSKLETERQAEVAGWLQAAKADKEFGGEKLAENLAVAKKAYDAFASQELKAVLDKTGLGNHPELIRAFYKAGQLIAEDQLVPGGAKPPGANKTAAQVLYGN